MSSPSCAALLVITACILLQALGLSLQLRLCRGGIYGGRWRDKCGTIPDKAGLPLAYVGD